MAFLTTGSEVVDSDSRLPAGKIRNSNAHVIRGLIAEAHCIPVPLGNAPDDLQAIVGKMREGFTGDALITCGGVSVGPLDLIPEALATTGCSISVRKVWIKPGMPFCFASGPQSHPIPIFCLPGNPVSAMVTFLEFVRPALETMSGTTGVDRTFELSASLEHDIVKNDSKLHLMRGIATLSRSSISVRSTGSQNSAVLTSLSKANCLIRIPEEVRSLKKGDSVHIELLSR